MLAQELQADIGFLFRKQSAFENGIAALQAKDPLLAKYLRQTRTWSEPLMEARNDVEHDGRTLPRISYERAGSGIAAIEPQISGLPITQFLKWILDRLFCYFEEFTIHCLQRQMPAQISIAEISLAQRSAELPTRFVLTIGVGGLPRRRIAYHSSLFEET